MSADNWTECPRCAKTASVEMGKRILDTDAQYGKVPLAEFDRLREQLEKDLAVLENKIESFREDWQIGLDGDTNQVEVEYKGSCNKCGLKVEFSYHHPIPGLAP